MLVSAIPLATVSRRCAEMTGQIQPRDESGEYRAPLNTLASKLALGEPSGPNLLDALRRLREQQVVAKAAVKPAEDTETKALKKSRKRFRKHVAEGVSPSRATVLAYAHYRSKGGKSGLDVWSRKVADGK